MLTKARQAFKKWRLSHLNRRISKLSGSSWVMPYGDIHQATYTSTKPLFFTDATSLKSFVDEVAHKNGTEYEVHINPASGENLPEDEQVENFINEAPGARRSLEIEFSHLDIKGEKDSAQYTILFTAKTPYKEACTTIDGAGNTALRDAIMSASDRYAKPMGIIQRHRSIPLVEPINAKEESDRRNRWETNWKNILVSAMTGLIAGLIPLVVKAALHI